MAEPKQFKVILRRANGRFVKEAIRPSKYAAKKLAELWDDKHPEMYTEIEQVGSESPVQTHCRLVNPLCPDDLCILPENHTGAAQGMHWLGTSGEMMLVSEVMYLSHRSHTPEELYQEGWEAAKSLWPEAFDD